MHDGAFVGGDGVRTRFEGSANMIDRGLAVARAKGRGLEQNIRLGEPQPLSNIVRRRRSRLRLRDEVVTKKSRWIESIFVGDPTHLPRCHAGNPPHDAPLAQFGILFLKQA